GVINRGQILKYGFYQAKHKYGQFRAQPLMLLVKTQRFQCLDCHTTFNATSYLFEHQRTISRDLKREIILRLTRIQTIKD
ncbi:ISL3 family transposase, partial [Limosilactobacillus reuteri]|nr:ISL3 family transposase [Limosilactobacillus reuteri]MCC4427162.1 ISL3 family transposase [Limosilactobacillus reuteri]MCC4433068.1 ISL3 family transposase [Limosilactobacillus reuteri]